MKKIITIIFLFISVIAVAQTPTSGSFKVWDLRVFNFLTDGNSEKAMYPLTRRLYDTAQAEVLNFQNRGAGIGITNVSNFYAYLKSTNLTASRTYEFPDSSGTLAIGVAGGYVQKITDAIQFDFFGPDDMEITNDNGGFTKAAIGLTGTSSFMSYNNSALNVRSDSLTYDFGNVWFGISSNGLSFNNFTSSTAKAFLRTPLLTGNRFYNLQDQSGILAMTIEDTLTTPLLIGGSGVTSKIELRSTTGAGTSTAVSHKFSGATNGANDSLITIHNDGQVLIGTKTRNPGALGIFRVRQGTSNIDMGQHSTGVAAIHLGKTTPSTTNYSIAGDGTNTYLNTVTGGNVFFMHNNAIRGSYGSTSYTFSPGAAGSNNTYFSFTQPANTGGVPTGILYTGGAHTGITASTEFTDVDFNASATATFATGNISTLRTYRMRGRTYAFAGSSTVTDAITLDVEAPVLGALAAFTNTIAIRASGNLSLIGGNRQINGSNGLTINAGGGSPVNLSQGNVLKYGIATTGQHSVTNAAQSSGTTPLMTFTQLANTGGSAGIFRIAGGAHTAQNSGTEINDINFNLARTVTWSTTVPSTQRWFRVQAPTSSCASVTNGDDLVTLDITSSAVAGSATYTRNWNTRFMGSGMLSVGGRAYFGDPNGTTAPSAQLHINSATLGVSVFKLSSTATNDDPGFEISQNRITTTNGTITYIDSIQIPASTTVKLTAELVARRTGGTAGTAEDGAAYNLKAAYKNVASTATAIGATIQEAWEDQAGWDAVFSVNGSYVRVGVTGATDNDVTWHLVEFKNSKVSQ